MIDIASVLVSVPAITATIQWVKSTFNISGRWCQLAAVIVGMIFTLISATLTYQNGLAWDSVARSLMEGFLYGLAAAGFYDLASGQLTHTTGATVDANTAPTTADSDTDDNVPFDGLLDPNFGLEHRSGKHEVHE